MAYAFDTLRYSERLKEGGFTPDQAKTAAEAARDFIMAELVTKSDLLGTTDALRHEMAALRSDLELQIKNLELSLTLRLGRMVAVMLTIAVGVLTAVIKLT